MKIDLEKATNARDLGGIVTAYGTVQQGRLIRSGQLSMITANDAQTLLSLNLSRVIDLRTDFEIANNPDVAIDGVSWVRVPIINTTTFGISYEKLNGAEIAVKLAAGIELMKSRNETPALRMQILYRKFVNDEFSRHGFGEFLKTLANKPVKGATLWHCSAGKDRVGACTALLLHCLGASRDVIVQDYMLTNEQTSDHLESIFNKVRPHVDDTLFQLVNKMLTVDESYIDGFFAEIESKYGSVDNFVAACGVTQQDVDNLRKNYLE